MGSKKVGKYLAYALGEIVLVVIGILIAVSINNWNEDTKRADELKTYLSTYKRDLVLDTTSIGKRLRKLEVERKVYNTFLQHDITKQDYIKDPRGISLIMIHSDLYLQEKGFHLLSNFVTNENGGQDSLVTRIVAKHSDFNKRIEESQDRIFDDIEENLNYLKNNQPWVADLLSGVWSNPDMLEYYVSDAYRSRLAVHNSMVNGNFMPLLKKFQNEAKGTLQMIDARLGE